MLVRRVPSAMRRVLCFGQNGGAIRFIFFSAGFQASTGRTTRRSSGTWEIAVVNVQSDFARTGTLRPDAFEVRDVAVERKVGSKRSAGGSWVCGWSVMIRQVGTALLRP